jgi:signal transduction histidine kinase
LTYTNGLWKVLIDRKGLYECLQNLVLNAQEAMAEGGNLEIAIENTSHSLTDGLFLASELRAGRYVRLSIKDSGTGISNGLLSRIFDPFYTTKVVGLGIGLGLSMVLGFIQKSGGAIAVTSEVNQGSTFHLYVPALADGPPASIDAF